MRGFTLLELIIIIVALALCGAALAAYMGNVANVAEPLARVHQTLDIQRVMENVAGDYNAGTDLATLAGRLDTPAGTTQKNNAYGEYVLPAGGLRWVKFSGANQMVDASVGDPQNALFVEIQNAQGQSLSGLFFR